MRRALVRLGLAAALFPGGLSGMAGDRALASDVRPAALPGAARAETGAPPSLTRIGPYGSPLALRPRPPAPIPGVDGVALRSETTGAPPPPASVAPLSRVAGSDRAASAGSGRPRWIDGEVDDDDAMPAAPGTLGRERIRIPEPSTVAGRKARRSPGAVTPDYEVPLGPKASLGMFGEVGQVELERSGLVPSVKARDLNAGVTLQYRFGP